MTSLNPTMKIGRQIEEVLKGRKGYSKKEVREKVLKILEMVGISDAKRDINNILMNSVAA